MTRKRLEFTYDYLGRRVEKIVKDNWNGTSGTIITHLKYVYDGWNVIAELNGAASNAVLRTYVWGLDLPGTTQGAGGVGGLLMVEDGTNKYVTAYDGNGNVSALLNATNGTLEAKYEYGAFGETIRMSGTGIGSVNPFRFSTKYTDDTTDLIYYGFRYYSPSLGRFLNRDPIAEEGGLNLHGFVNNNSVNLWDYLGLVVIIEIDQELEVLGESEYYFVLDESGVTVNTGDFGDVWGEQGYGLDGDPTDMGIFGDLDFGSFDAFGQEFDSLSEPFGFDDGFGDGPIPEIPEVTFLYDQDFDGQSQGEQRNQLSDAARRQLQIRLRLQGINNDIAQGNSVQDALGSVKAAATGVAQAGDSWVKRYCYW